MPTTSSTDSADPRYAADLWRLALVVGLLFFLFLGTRPLGNPDEGRYAEIPREMAMTNDYVTPRLDGVKYFEKPPLVYWLTALTMEVGGVNEIAVRFWPALLGVAGVLLTYAAGRALYDRATGIAAAGVLATTIFYYGLTRLALLDGAVSVLIAAALYAFIVGVRLPRGGPRRLLFAAFYVAMALAVLTKGLIGLVLPCAVVGLWVLLLNRWKQLWPFYPFFGTVIVLVVAAPWHLLAAKANSDFLWFYFVHEHFQRFTSRVHDRYAPWWYFVPILVGGLFPWVMFAGQALKQNLAGGWRERVRNEAAWFLVIWIAFIFLFFSKSQSKLPPYILPLFPAMAVLIGRYLSSVWQNPEHRRSAVALGIYAVFAILVGAALPFVKVVRDDVMRAELRPWQLLLATTFAASGAVVGYLVIRRRTRAALVAVGVGTALSLIVLNPAAARADKRSSRDLALALRAQVQPGDQVYSYKYYFQDLPVYLGRLVDVVDYEGELEFGIHAEPEKTASRFIGPEEFLRRWGGTGRCFAVARKGDFTALRSKPGFQAVILAEYRDQILFSNR